MKPDLKRAAASLKGNAAWASLDVATSAWSHKDRLRDPAQRGDAMRDVAWDAGESVVKSAASTGAASAAGVALVAAAESGAALGAVVGGSAAVAAAAPFVAGLVASYASGKVIKVARTRVRGK